MVKVNAVLSFMLSELCRTKTLCVRVCLISSFSRLMDCPAPKRCINVDGGDASDRIVKSGVIKRVENGLSSTTQLPQWARCLPFLTVNDQGKPGLLVFFVSMFAKREFQKFRSSVLRLVVFLKRNGM